MVKKLDAIKIYEIAECGNTAFEEVSLGNKNMVGKMKRLSLDHQIANGTTKIKSP